MRTVVYDDDKKFLDFIKNTLDKINTKHGNILGAPVYFSEANEVKEYVSENREHLIVSLLDIMDDNIEVGYELANYIKAIEPRNIVIYVSDFPTKYTSNVDETIISHAFIPKENDNLCGALEKALTSAHSMVAKKVFLAEDKNEIIAIKYEDILFFEKVKHKKLIKLFHKDGYIYINNTLKNIKSQLECSGVFFSSTKGFIVNLKNIKQIKKTEEILVFNNGELVPFSPKLRTRLIKCMSAQL